MTTAEVTPAAGSTAARVTIAKETPHAMSPLLASRHPRFGHLLPGLGLAAVLLGSQGLAASSPLPSAVRLLLPSEGLLAGLGDGLRRGYGLAMEQARACGLEPPGLGLGWLPPGADPERALASLARSQLVIAPPAAPLEPYGRLAEQQRLTVLLPLQRGSSLERLPQLPGSDRLWPLVPARSLVADRLAQGLLAANRGSVMVVRDRSGEARALAERFSASLRTGGGRTTGVQDDPLAIDAKDAKALAQLRADVDWYRPQALVVFTRPGSGLARALRQASWPAELVLAWPFPLQSNQEIGPTAQLGVDPQGRGEGWSAFERSFQARWGYRPALVEAAGYDTGQLTALASLAPDGRPGWDLAWFRPLGRSLPLCEAIRARRSGQTVRPRGAASRLDQTAGTPPTATLQLTPVPAQP
ncbi:ABC transporter substrate-binding protein [Vulcanococcus limneticus]|uniref:ABC transporter substrate-binding protein n=1 Tax=Vulcanococcus limneticus TaxID=2170428 RepID=UPI00398BCD48